MADDSTVSIRITGAVDSSLTSSTAAAQSAIAGLGTSAAGAVAPLQTLGSSLGTVNENLNGTSGNLERVAPAAKGGGAGFDLMSLAADGLKSRMESLPGAILGFGDSAFRSAAALQDQSEMLGLSTSALQAYQFAARQSGVGTEEADAALKQFLSGLDQIESGTGPAAKAIQELGLNTETLRGGPAEALQTFAFALDRVTDAQKKANLEREVFGSDGQDIDTLVHRLAGGLDEQYKAAVAAGEALDPTLTGAAKESAIMVDSFGAKLKVVAGTVMIGFIETARELGGALAAIDWGANSPAASFLSVRPAANKPPPQFGPEVTNPAMVKPQAPDIAPPNIQIDDPAKNAAKAQEEAQKIISIDKQISEAILAGQEQLNASKLALGRESLADFVKQEKDLAQQKYDADRKALEQEAATGKISHAELTAELALLDAQYANKKAAIDDRAAEKQRENDNKAFADHEKVEQEQVKTTEDADARAFRSGQITAQQKDALDLAAIQTAKQNVDQAFAIHTAGWDQESQAYKDELQKRLDFDKWYDEQRKGVEKASADAQVAQWRTTDQQIESAESELVSDIFSKRQGLGADLRQIGLKMLEDEITNDLKALTEHELVNLGMLNADKVTAQEGMLAHAASWLLQTAFAKQQVAAQTASITAGVTAQNAAQSAGKAAGMAEAVAMGSAQISNDAMVGASGAYSALASIPIVGPFLGAAAAGVTFAAIMGYDALTSAEGGQLSVPFDGQLTELHRDEMVLPASIAGPMRDAFAGDGGGAKSGDSYNLGGLHIHGFDLPSIAHNPAFQRDAMKVIRNMHRNAVRR